MLLESFLLFQICKTACLIKIAKKILLHCSQYSRPPQYPCPPFVHRLPQYRRFFVRPEIAVLGGTTVSIFAEKLSFVINNMNWCTSYFSISCHTADEHPTDCWHIWVATLPWKIRDPWIALIFSANPGIALFLFVGPDLAFWALFFLWKSLLNRVKKAFFWNFCLHPRPYSKIFSLKWSTLAWFCPIF